MEKFFNVAGPCNPAKHYMLPATERLPDVMRLIRQEQYFAIHAARQSGKTTLLQGLVRDINASGECVEEIHDCDYSSPITAEDVATAKETIIRRDPIHLFYLFDMMKHPRIEPFFRDAISGKALNSETDVEAFNFFKALGLFCNGGAKWNFANPMYAASWERRSGR